MLLVNIVVLALVCHAALGLKCYRCNSTTSKNCNEGECTGNVCMKEIQTTYDERTKTSQEKTFKYCKRDGTVGCFHGTSSVVNVWYCMCDTDLCNGAMTARISSFAFGIMTLVGAFAVGMHWR